MFDHAAQACDKSGNSNVEDLPDAPARAFRDADGQINLIASAPTTRRSIGSTFNTLKRDCNNVLMRSDFDQDAADYSDTEWMVAPYTTDGTTVHAIIHNEHHPWEHAEFCDRMR